MDLLERLTLAAEGARQEVADASDRPAGTAPCGAPSATRLATFNVGGHAIPIYPAAGPGGRRFPLLKAMLTTVCERDCNYCSFRSQHDQRRVTFQPEEMARAFDQALRGGSSRGYSCPRGSPAAGPTPRSG